MSQPERQTTAVTTDEELDDARRASIENALQAYQETILEQNLKALQIIVDGLEKKFGPSDVPGKRRTEEEAAHFHLRLLRDEYRILPPDMTLTKARDILADENRDAVVAYCRLDGTDHGPVEPEQRRNWWAALQGAANELEIQPRPPGLPPDLVYLSTLVRGVRGAPLPFQYWNCEYPLLIEIEEAMMRLASDADEAEDRVVVPVPESELQADDSNLTALTGAWEDDWNIPVGIRLGDRQEAWPGCYALFCRPLNQSGDWQWRYGLHDEAYDSEVFDSIEEFLAWHAQLHYAHKGNIPIG